MQPGFPFQVGGLYKGGLVNGLPTWSQPGGPGTPVLPAFPQQYPQVPQGFPQQVFAYEGLYIFSCGHWTNTIETFQVYDPYTEMQALLLCCPLCSFIQQIVEPASLWYNDFYGLYQMGLGSKTFVPSGV